MVDKEFEQLLVRIPPFWRARLVETKNKQNVLNSPNLPVNDVVVAAIAAWCDIIDERWEREYGND